ncbi:AAA family ATPase [Microvirga sp. STR05]|uniref:AAA family ATPase n=1 Tax=Hymenobacter duratus TaxID=2771356 RepID=A0ABR8JCE4_9BACT|nr:AAA family ATPase [Hymenobacter duratus]MBD2714368.1 AAA family ATPase [Hymenobacter duratus]MBR7949271.1 AAA family ATPase [Microvirga sp. STR05]
MDANDLHTSSAVSERQGEETKPSLNNSMAPLRRMPFISQDDVNSLLEDMGRLPKQSERTGEVPLIRQDDCVFTLGELLDRPSAEIPQLVSPFLQRKGVAMLAGSSDTGKSSFLRQLALAVANEASNFLGFSIQAKHNSAICVSTEDNDEAIGALLNKQLRDQTISDAARNRLRFVFNTDDLPTRLDRMLIECPADLVIVDALGDLFDGNLNQSNEVRRFIAKYNDLANKHGCLVLFMHHTSKRSEDREPSKNNLLGSQGLEAKMRVVFELRADPYDREVRHLCILKGNYIASELKQKSYVLRFDENLVFHNTGKRAQFGDLVKSTVENPNERELWSAAKELLQAGNSYDKVATLLEPIAKNLGMNTISRATLNRRLPKSSLHPAISPSQSL